jgi:hypothetical protein
MITALQQTDKTKAKKSSIGEIVAPSPQVPAPTSPVVETMQQASQQPIESVVVDKPQQKQTSIDYQNKLVSQIKNKAQDVVASDTAIAPPVKLSTPTIKTVDITKYTPKQVALAQKQ